MTEHTLDPSQQRAVDLILSVPFGVVTGGPGTGKTTTLRAALDQLDKRPLPVDAFGDTMQRYVLAAPTGKAARRMQEATGRPAGTIHRLLEYAGRGFSRNADYPLETGLVVIDEASMVDVRLARALLDAIHEERTRLVLIGDANQLPSVGPGRVLADLVESGGVPVARLTTLHRAAAESWVCRNAGAILEGREPELVPTPDFRFVPVETSEGAARAVVELVGPGAGAFEGAAWQVLTPQRPGPAGTSALNKALQAQLNPRVPGEPTSKLGEDGELRLRDRVIQTSNDYTRGVFNGEVGDVVSIDKSEVVVDFEGRLVAYDALAARALQLAYALTVHKSQGSEWPWVVVVCHSAHTFSLSRQLLYTAVTRAKKGVVIVGDRKGLAAALSNTRPNERFTTLGERLAMPASNAAAAPGASAGAEVPR